MSYDHKAEESDRLFKALDPVGYKRRQQQIHAMLRDTANHCVMCGFFLGVKPRSDFFIIPKKRKCPTCGYEGEM